ncbi:hypothetical protein LCGC14_2757140, partial [marine sediment metagenome]
MLSRIIWLQDINPLVAAGAGMEGGAQLTDRT